MTAETCAGRSGLLSGNAPGIQSRTSDIFLLDQVMSSEHLNALIILLKLDRTGKKVLLIVLIFLCPCFTTLDTPPLRSGGSVWFFMMSLCDSRVLQETQQCISLGYSNVNGVKSSQNNKKGSL